MQTKPTLIKCIFDSSQEVTKWIVSQDPSAFNKGPVGKWDTSQHLDHLTKTATLTTRGLKMPKLLLRWKFGKTNRPLRNKQEIIDRYQERLNDLPPGKTFSGSAGVSSTDKSATLAQYKESILTLNTVIEKRWNEKALDKHLLPHPLMGRMPIRELLIWFDYHHYHHLEVLKDRY